MPWDYRVGLYTWTKSIAAGLYLVAAALVLLGVLEADNVLWQWVAPIGAATFLAVTGGILIWDLEHPERTEISVPAGMSGPVQASRSASSALISQV